MKCILFYKLKRAVIECECGKRYNLKPDDSFHFTCSSCERDIEFYPDDEPCDILEYEEEL
jgi:hypothetical protein